MKILVTGAGGYLGHQLVQRLAMKGHQVRAMVRSCRTNAIPQLPNVEIVKGDILDNLSLLSAMQGCEQVFHTAGKVGGWTKDPSVFYQVNGTGTKNVMEAALKTGISKLVFTSSAGVIGPSNGRPLTEMDKRPEEFGIDYDLSKKEAEDICIEYAAKGLNAVAVLPAKVFGPGQVSHALTGNALIARFIYKGIAMVPAPGTYQVCFSFIEDVVDGHIRAMEYGHRGERYIIGGVNISYIDFFERIRKLSSTKGRIIKVPKNIVRAWAYFQQLKYEITGNPPLFAARAVDYAFNNYAFSSDKATRELGYTITPLNEALDRTIHYIKEHFPH